MDCKQALYRLTLGLEACSGASFSAALRKQGHDVQLIVAVKRFVKSNTDFVSVEASICNLRNEYEILDCDL
jgi:hypothetical protein